MKDEKTALVLIGTPKQGPGASTSLATHIACNLAGAGFEIETVRAVQAVRSPEAIQSLFDALDAANVVVVVFPLYVDSLPAPLTKAFELLAAHRREARIEGSPRLMAVCQNGFPESRQNEPALENCRLFCREAGVEWAGGLAFGGGGFVAGRELAKAGGPTRNLVKGLNMACEDLISGNPVRPEAAALVAKQTMPSWLYLMIGSFQWRRLAKKNGTAGRLRDRPYAR
jgi:hypothetical protein